ncbi:MAG: hypothetical protein ABI472_05450 [Ginsengibacter sp.]
MIKFLQLLLDWSEVWAPLIPLIVLLFRWKQPGFLRPVIIYLVFAFFINLAGDVISDFKPYLPRWLHSNNVLYNIHSIVRFICFGYFFLALKQPSFITMKKVLPFISLLIIIINFNFVENFGNPGHLSGNLLATEAYFLLIYCVLYYLAKLRDEEDDLMQGADFWVATGLSIYVVVNFFVFLFYVPMIDQDINLTENIWDVHNIAYIILCIFITKAFYEPARYQHAI